MEAVIADAFAQVDAGLAATALAGASEEAVKIFWKKVEDELKKFDDASQLHYQQIKQSLYGIIKKFSERSPQFSALEAEITANEKVILQFNDDVGHFYKGIKQRVERLEKIDSMIDDAVYTLDELVDQFKFSNLGFGDFVTMLSDIWFTHAKLKKAAEMAGKVQAEPWVPPSAFIRSTRKYWVRGEDLTKLKLAIARNLPLLRFGKKQGCIVETNPTVTVAGFKNFNNDYDGEGAADEAKLTSIYFDNAKLRLYHDKIARKEGATLVRVRWYGKEGSMCFIERKTWHDSWVLNDSIKERFDLKYDEVAPFMAGKLTAREIVEDFAKKKAGKLSEVNLREMLGLAETVQERVLNLDLKPSVRTVYNRTAFQASDSNNIRISIDTNLELSAEPDVMPQGRWCYDSTLPIPENMKFMFPLAVLEIKLSGVTETPEWIQNIIDSDYVVDAYKFSKFLHSTAALKGQLCKVVPSWFNRPIVHLQGVPLKQWYRSPVDLVVNKLGFEEVVKWQSYAPQYYPRATRPGLIENRELGAMIHLEPGDSSLDLSPEKLQARAKEAEPESTVIAMPAAKKPEAPLSSSISGPLPTSSAPGSQRYKMGSIDARGNITGAGILDDNESLIASTPSKAGTELLNLADGKKRSATQNLVDVQDNNPPSFIERLTSCCRKKPDPKVVGGKGEIVPVIPFEKMEPKTFFANERTFLHWIHVALTVAVGGFGLAQLSHSDSMFWVGVGTLIVALGMAIYSLRVYHWRRHLIRYGSPEQPLDDKYGPPVLTIIIVIYLVTTIVFHYMSGNGLAIFHPTPALGFVPNVTVRDFQLNLDPEAFANASTFNNAMFQLSVNLTIALRGAGLDEKAVRGDVTILRSTSQFQFFDSSVTCELRQQGLRFIRRMDADNSSIFTYQYRSVVAPLLTVLDKKLPLPPSYSKEELIFTGFTLLHARAVDARSIVVDDDDEVLVSELARFAPLPLPDSTDPLVPVNNITLQLDRYGDLQIDFGGDNPPADVFVYIWSHDGDVVYAQLVMRFSFTSMKLKEITTIRAGFDAMNNMIGVSKTFSDVVTDYVYPFDEFCEDLSNKKEVDEEL